MASPIAMLNKGVRQMDLGMGLLGWGLNAGLALVKRAEAA